MNKSVKCSSRSEQTPASSLALGFLAQGDKRTRFGIHSRIREVFYIRDSLEGFASENGDIVPRAQFLSIGRHVLHTDIQRQYFRRSRDPTGSGGGILSLLVGYLGQRNPRVAVFGSDSRPYRGIENRGNDWTEGF